MSRGPNPEQLKAIQHEGGVLLRAGAGSGKTFVLVEHILYLTKKWIDDFIKNPDGRFEEFIRQKFSEVVMMTFTKKAAGELSIRLTEKFNEVVIQNDDDYWRAANEALPILVVTTIDGFCRKLITNGYFPHLSTEAKVIFGPERTEQIKLLVESWVEEAGHELDPPVLDILLREKKDLLTAFTSIFSDPGLRLAWKKFRLEEIGPNKLSNILSLTFSLNNISEALLKVQQLDLPEDSDRSAFEKVVGNFQAVGLPEIKNVDNLNIYFNLFNQIKSLRGEATAKKKTIAHEAAHEGLKELRDWVKKWHPVVADYQEHFEAKVLPWMKLCQEIFLFIDKNLDPNNGMTFGDIEYFVSLGLENKTDQERVQKAFRYFIVDEFQDTSELQFKIIRSLINEDYKRLFCVGDAKQAIYGFRGGELSVFQDCGELVPQVLSLVNNYRSSPEIIHFNNSLFKTILPLGQEFLGHDPFSVTPEDQDVPAEIEQKKKGEVEVLTAVIDWNSESDEKFSSEDINRLEARFISDSILKERKEKPDQVCTVLYSKLRPSGELIRFLMEKKIGFTAQFKIDVSDDPVLGIFLALIQRKFDYKQDRNHFPLFLIESYLRILSLPCLINERDFEDFDNDIQFWGILPAFRKFLHKLSITNENSDINLETIQTFSSLYHQDLESIMLQLKKGDNDRLSLELRSGEKSSMVQIMSAHASKGLEFATVYLAGIYTNGREMNLGSLFGNMPGSFKWYLDLVKKEKQSSPAYVLENELSSYKNFSESKRLFYVAATRAKNKLLWVDFDLPEKSFSIPGNSWVYGLRVWESRMSDITFLKKEVSEKLSAREVTGSLSLPQLPLFFHDSMGIISKGLEKSELLISAELSVTRLNSLMDCPRKFYLSNTLKLSETKKISKDFVEEESEELATIMRSSTERGTLIHAQIAEGVLRNFVVPRASFGTNLHAPIEWALQLLASQKDTFEFIPEKPLKFKLFNFMISGTPDLVLLPKGEQNAQVWDFKTGRITQENLNHYWLQLTVYAYALYELGEVEKNQDVEIILSFVDQKKNLSEKVSWKSCQEKLYPLWVSQNTPWKINTDHCSQCSYGDICPR